MRENWRTFSFWDGHGCSVGDENGGLRSREEGGGALIFS